MNLLFETGVFEDSIQQALVDVSIGMDGHSGGPGSLLQPEMTPSYADNGPPVLTKQLKQVFTAHRSFSRQMP